MYCHVDLSHENIWIFHSPGPNPSAPRILAYVRYSRMAYTYESTPYTRP